MKVLMKVDLDDFGKYEVQSEKIETGEELKSVFEELFNQVYKELHLGCSVSKTEIEGYPAIHLEDPDTQMTRKVVIEKLEA